MFVQVIRGRVDDAAALHKQMDRWNDELRPGAEGFLGSTSGVTDDGRMVAVARFASAAAAERNAGRPEQSAWWAATEALIEGATFADTEDVETLLAGGSNDAGFVQVMVSRPSDRNRLRAANEKAESVLPSFRPDLIGSLTAWMTDGTCTDVAYFTSEREAREAEAKEIPPELLDAWKEMQEVMGEVEYLDLRDPWFA